MPQPGKPAPRGEDWFVRELQNLRRELQELKAANPFGLTGIDPQDGGTEFDGYVNVNGEMNVAGPMSITGALNLPAGIIGNDALTSPLFPKTVHTDITNFSLSTGPNVAKAIATVSVPAGYTSALVFATTSMSAQNVTAASDSCFLGCVINGASIGYAPYTDVPASKVGTVAASGSALLTGLGASFPIAAKASSNAANWAATTSNIVNIDAIVLFLR